MQAKLTQKVLAHIEIILLTILLAFNYQLFIADNGFAPTGINGIATMVQYKVEFRKILKKYDNMFSFSETVNGTYENFAHIK